MGLKREGFLDNQALEGVVRKKGLASKIDCHDINTALIRFRLDVTTLKVVGVELESMGPSYSTGYFFKKGIGCIRSVFGASQ